MLTILVAASLLIGLVDAVKAPWRECPLPSNITHIETNAGGRERKTYYDGSVPHLSTLREKYTALAHCPNIERLELKTKLYGCSGWPDAFTFDSPSQTRRRFPALKEVRLEGYDFDDKPADYKRRVLKYPIHVSDTSLPAWYVEWSYWLTSGKARAALHENAPAWMGLGPYITAADMFSSSDYWLDAMDWSKVEALAIKEPSLAVLQQLPSKLASLRKLKLHMGGSYTYSEAKNPDCDRSIRGNCDPEALLVRFIEQLPNSATLGKLSLTNYWNANSIVEMLTTEKLASLNDLNLRYDAADSYFGVHNNSSGIEDQDHGVHLRASHIALINTLASNLSSFSMITSRNTTVRTETLKWLSEMQNLEHLQLQIQLSPGQRAYSPHRDAFHYRMELNAVDRLGGMEDQRAIDQRITEEIARTMKPRINESMALDTFKELRESKQGRELRSLEMETLSQWVGPDPNVPFTILMLKSGLR